MEYYKEYPIRCKHCGELLSIYAKIYNELLDIGYSHEEVANQLLITDPCSRAAMANPTTVIFDMENREVIEGFKSVDAVVDPDLVNPRFTNPTTSIFASCMGTPPPPQTINPLFAQFMAPTQVQTRTIALATGNSVIAPIVPVGDVPVGEAIDVTATEVEEFKIPTIVGIPTINPDPTYVSPTIFVGRNAQVKILNGRTYLAQ